MDKWEYKNFTIDKGDALDMVLANTIGKDGWELVAIYEYTSNRIAAAFKRKLKK